MRLNKMLGYRLEEITKLLTQIRRNYFRCPQDKTFGASEKMNWLNKSIIADYITVTYLLENVVNLDEYDLRPIYCILRSTLEKYADILNFNVYENDYAVYLDYLNIESELRMLVVFDNSYRINEVKKNKKKLFDDAKEIFSLTFLNRKTRYYLLKKGFNTKYKDNTDYSIQHGIAFNDNIDRVDTQFSQILHNNKETYNANNCFKVQEILKSLLAMLYLTECSFDYYFGLNSVNYVQECLYLLRQTLINVNSNYYSFFEN